MELEKRHFHGWNLRQELKSDGHCPYWHAYKRENKKLNHKYLGKVLPDNLEEILGVDMNDVLRQQFLTLLDGKKEITQITVDVIENGVSEEIVLYKNNVK